MKKILLLMSVLLMSITMLVAGDYDELMKLVASDRATNDQFGTSVSISGDYAIVGADGKDDNAGAAYIYIRDGASWSQQAKLVASDRAAGDIFGLSVSISSDYAIVGAQTEDHDAFGADSLSSAGSAYIFKRDGVSWSQQAKLVASDRAVNDRFGNSVSISGDYVIIGAKREDHDVSDANELIDAGAAYIFKRDGTSWSQQAKLVASDRNANDRFGISVSISGDYAIVGAHWEDHDALGVNELSNAGSAYIFMRDGVSWSQQAKLVASDRAAGDIFGLSVSISGDYAIVGAYGQDHDVSGANELSNAGSAYIFMRDGVSWFQQAKLVASDRNEEDWFGNPVSISGDYAIVGAYWEDHDASGENELSDAGSAYMFKRDGVSWAQQAKLVASDRDVDDRFGWSVSISGDYAIVGANTEDHDAFGANELSNAGSAYMFSVPASEVPLPISLASFGAKVQGGSVELSWKTASETDNAHFLIYRNDEVIASIDGAGTTSEPQSYSFTDNTVVPGVSYTYVLADVSYANEETRYTNEAVIVTVPENDIPQEFALEANYPNPFNPRTAISYSIFAEATMDRQLSVNLSIFDMSGKKVATLVNESQAAGYYEVNWDASDFTSGIYFYRLTAGNFVETKKMVLMK